jgi:hypothetical protein
MESVSIFEHYQTMGRQGVVFVFRGSMSQALLVRFGETIRKDLFSAPKKLPEIRKVFSVFVELAQNITRYSAERSTEGGEGETGRGIIVVSETADHYTVASGNRIENARVSLLAGQMEAMQGLTPETLRRQYREQLKQAQPEGSAGAGLGLLDMARRSGGMLRFAVHPVDERTSFIEVFVDIRKETHGGQA